MRKIVKVVLTIALVLLCCYIAAFIVARLWEFYVRTVAHEYPIDKGVPISEVQAVVQSNAELFASYEIIAFQAEWGRLLFIVSEDATASDSRMMIEFDCERQIVISPLNEDEDIHHREGNGLPFTVFLKMLEMAGAKLAEKQESHLGILYMIFSNDMVGFYFGETNYSLGGSGTSIWFRNIDENWEISSCGSWIQ